MVPVYFDESEKYASSALTRLRRSDFIAVTYAFDFVLANFGIAIAARMPMMTITIRSSISVKPLRFILTCSVGWDFCKCCGGLWEGRQCRCQIVAPNLSVYG